MRRTFFIIGCVALIALIVIAGWRAQPRSRASPSGTGVFRETLKEAVTNSVELVRKEITGGVGVMLTTGPGPGQTMIQGVGVGSPGEQAGLRVGDIIVEVDGWATTGKPLMEITERIRGYTAGKVTLTVQRGDPTNLVDCVIRRTSWNNLNEMKFNQTPGTNR